MCWKGTELGGGGTDLTITRGTSDEGYLVVWGSTPHVLHVPSSVLLSSCFKRKLHLEKWAETLMVTELIHVLGKSRIHTELPQAATLPPCLFHRLNVHQSDLGGKAWNKTLVLFCFEEIDSCLFWEKRTLSTVIFYWTVRLPEHHKT